MKFEKYKLFENFEAERPLVRPDNSALHVANFVVDRKINDQCGVDLILSGTFVESTMARILLEEVTAQDLEPGVAEETFALLTGYLHARYSNGKAIIQISDQGLLVPSRLTQGGNVKNWAIAQEKSLGSLAATADTMINTMDRANYYSEEPDLDGNHVDWAEAGKLAHDTFFEHGEHAFNIYGDD